MKGTDSCLMVVFMLAHMHKEVSQCNDYGWCLSQSARVMTPALDRDFEFWLAINKVHTEHAHTHMHPGPLMHVNIGLATSI